MLIEINEDYIQWVKSNTSVDCDSDVITEYINEVLENHKQSWEALSDEEFSI